MKTGETVLLSVGSKNDVIVFGRERRGGRANSNRPTRVSFVGRFNKVSKSDSWMYFDTKDETDFEKYSLQYSYACNVFKVRVTLFSGVGNVIITML